MKTTAEVVKVGDAFAWIEDARAIGMRAVSREGKPIELTAAQARVFAERLGRLADVLERLMEQERERADD